MTDPTYIYRAIVLSVADDADLQLAIDVGFGLTVRKKVALRNLPTSDVRRMVTVMRSILERDREVTVQTVKLGDEYAAAQVWLRKERLRDMLVAQGVLSR